MLCQPATVCPAGIGGAATNARKESPRRRDGRRDGGLGGLAKNRAHEAEEGDKKLSGRGYIQPISRESEVCKLKEETELDGARVTTC